VILPEDQGDSFSSSVGLKLVSKVSSCSIACLNHQWTWTPAVLAPWLSTSSVSYSQKQWQNHQFCRLNARVVS